MATDAELEALLTLQVNGQHCWMPGSRPDIRLDHARSMLRILELKRTTTPPQPEASGQWSRVGDTDYG